MILLLIAVLAGAITVLHKFVTSRSTRSPPVSFKAAYNYSYCSGWNANADYGPGETVKRY